MENSAKVDKFKTKLPNKEIILDIPWDQQPPYDKPRPFFRLGNLTDYYSSSILTQTTEHLLNALRNSNSLNGLNLSDPLISGVYTKDWDKSWDILIEFFLQVKGTSNFYFFEAELNTSQKAITQAFSPKIYKCTCFQILEEVDIPETLTRIADSSLKSFEFGKYSLYEVVNVISARKLFEYKFLNPEHYIISCYISDSYHNQYIALLSVSIEEDTNEAIPANVEIINSYIDFFEVSNNLSYEIFSPEKVKGSPHFKAVIDHVKKEKLLGDVVYKKDPSELVSGLSLKQPKQNYLEIILNFISIPKFVYQIHLSCEKKRDKLTIKTTKTEKYPMNERNSSKKKFPTIKEIQTTFDNYVNQQGKTMTRFKNFEVTKIWSCSFVSNDDLIFPEQMEVRFSGKNKGNIDLIHMIITYAVHDFDEETIPVSLYLLDFKGSFLSDLDIVLQGDYIYECDNSKKVYKKNSKLLFEMPINGDKLSVNLKEFIDIHIPIIKNELKENVSSIQIKERTTSNIIYSNLLTYDNCHELYAIITMKMKDSDDTIFHQLNVRINDIQEKSSELKLLKSFILKPLNESEYLPYEVLNSIVWGNTFNMNFLGFEVIKMKRSCLLDDSYFKYIYYLEFNNSQSKTNQKILFAEKKGNVYVALKPVSYCLNRKSK
jgi:hypothetical protein